jgi:raffinose/stachyose/melibiose transport system substrate-binding protein
VKFHRTRRAQLISAAVISAAALLLAGCASGTPSSTSTAKAAGKDGKSFSVLLTTEDSQTPQMLKILASGACKSENKALPLSIQQTPSANLAEKVQLLASQNALPVMYAADNTTIIPGGTYYKNGEVLDISKALTSAGVGSNMTAIAKSTILQQFQGTVPSIPFQFNIEGLFYNKKIFKDNGITVPTTYAELLTDAAKLKAAGVTPISSSGAAGWPISRWIGILLYRELGPDAMKNIQDGKAKLTDPEYVKAATQLQTMGKDGYFSAGITNLDYNTAVSQFLTGKAAMIYMGTWLLAGINDPKQNTQGNNIGFMPFPAVTGGKGSINQYPANSGSANVVNAKLYGPKAQAWLKCIAANYGSASLQKQGTYSGFALNQKVASLPPLTAAIGKTIGSTSGGVLWFEAYFGVKENADASANAAALLTGQMTPTQYMSILQADSSQS